MNSEQMQEYAKANIKNYGFLLMLDVPEKMQFGIDNQQWRIGPKFMGLKLIPPGAHFVFYSLNDEEFQYNQGFWIFVPDQLSKNQFQNFHDREFYQQINIRKFCRSRQKFLKLENEQEEISYREGVKNMDFDKNLGIFQIDDFNQWIGLSTHISPIILQKLYQNTDTENQNKEKTIDNDKIKQNKIDIDEALDELKQKLSEVSISEKQEKSEQKQVHDSLVNQIEDLLQNENCILLNYSEVLYNNNQKFHQTKKQFDTSEHLFQLLQTIKIDFQKIDYCINEYDYILGELQTSFVLFLLLQDLHSFQQWKKLILIICQCQRAILDQLKIDNQLKEFFIKFIPLFYNQIEQLSDEFFSQNDEIGVKKDNFIKFAIQQLVQIVEGSECKILKKRTQVLKQMASKHFGILTADDVIQKSLQSISLEQSMKDQIDSLRRQIKQQIEVQNDLDSLDQEDFPEIVDVNEEFIQF